MFSAGSGWLFASVGLLGSVELARLTVALEVQCRRHDGAAARRPGEQSAQASRVSPAGHHRRASPNARHGFQHVADRRIVELVAPGDLVVTADIPLAADVVAKGAEAIDPRGGLYTHANIGERIAMRNVIDQLRGGGQVSGGPPNFGPKDRQAFANQLDRWLVKEGDSVNKDDRVLAPTTGLVCYLANAFRRLKMPGASPAGYLQENTGAL
jgi:uncharacterized protein YaiI (UPF0178 family)